MIANAGICIPSAGFLDSTLSSPTIIGSPTLFFSLATTEDFQRIFTVNTLSTFLCYKYAAKQMIKQGRGGRIIGASSLAGKTGA